MNDLRSTAALIALVLGIVCGTILSIVGVDAEPAWAVAGGASLYLYGLHSELQDGES